MEEVSKMTLGEHYEKEPYMWNLKSKNWDSLDLYQKVQS